MRLPYQTEVDPTLLHQVKFLLRNHSSVVVVGCNCIGDKDMGQSNNLDEARELYNNPENHDKDFTEEWRATW